MDWTQQVNGEGDGAPPPKAQPSRVTHTPEVGQVFVQANAEPSAEPPVEAVASARDAFGANLARVRATWKKVALAATMKRWQRRAAPHVARVTVCILLLGGGAMVTEWIMHRAPTVVPIATQHPSVAPGGVVTVSPELPTPTGISTPAPAAASRVPSRPVPSTSSALTVAPPTAVAPPVQGMPAARPSVPSPGGQRKPHDPSASAKAKNQKVSEDLDAFFRKRAQAHDRETQAWEKTQSEKLDQFFQGKSR